MLYKMKDVDVEDFNIPDSPVSESPRLEQNINMPSTSRGTVNNYPKYKSGKSSFVKKNDVKSPASPGSFV